MVVIVIRHRSQKKIGEPFRRLTVRQVRRLASVTFKEFFMHYLIDDHSQEAPHGDHRINPAERALSDPFF